MSTSIKSKNVNRFGLATTVTLALLYSGQAYAQESGAKADAPAQTEGQLGDIVVTASKRSDSAQRVPATVLAVSGDVLQNKAIKSAGDLVKIAPAIQFSPVRQNATVYIRGLGQYGAGPNIDPYVATNFNGAYLPKEVAGAALFDVDRVEVLYGPQGTLYGRNSIAGVINVYSKKPEFTFGGEAMIEYGNYDTINMTGVLNVPLSDTLAARVAVNRARHSGYATNGAFDQDQDDIRLSLLFKPSDRTTINILGQYSHSGGIGEMFMNKPPVCGYWCVGADPRKLGNFADVPIYIVNMSIEHQLSDSLTVTNTAAYNSLSGNAQLLSYLNVPFNPVSALGSPQVKNYSDELRFNYTSDRLKAVFGGFAFHSDGSYGTTIVTANQGAISQNGPFFDHATGLAAFGDVTYLVSDHFRAIGGIRYSYDKRKMHGTNGVISGDVQTITQTYAGRRSSNRVDFKIGAQYDIAPQSMLYATFQTGYNGGGFSDAPLSTGSNQAAPYSPTTVKSGIVGIKNRFFNNRVQLNIEAFYNDYKDYQVSARNVATGRNTTYNAEKARTWGVQVDSRYQITPEDELGIGFDVLRAKMDKLILPVAPFANYSGLDLPYAPHFTIHADYRHTFNLANGGTVDFLVDSRYQTKVWLLYSHNPGTDQKAYSMTDASLTYRPESKDWSIGVWAKNITNTHAWSIAVPAPPGPAVGELHPPRTYGVRATARF